VVIVLIVYLCGRVVLVTCAAGTYIDERIRISIKRRT